MPTLSASAYVVLGLLEQSGAATPYALDREIQQSIGHFWAFPRSQIYAEAARLVRRGLVVEEQESTGRRRRTLSLTQAGRDVLAAWLAGPSENAANIQDEGLLRLYFQRPERPPGNAQIKKLAAEQGDAHRRKLAEYQNILASALNASPDATRPGTQLEPTQAATLTFGMRFEEMAVKFWDEVAEHEQIDGKPHSKE
ncbi:PadR family transcriptional regulator [Streptomyces parvulus]|uniref:PadR family transcriptional regulator n=1 Tax=Streptomyces parvulus TaxID=146923 RepID=UPI0034183260